LPVGSRPQLPTAFWTFSLVLSSHSTMNRAIIAVTSPHKLLSRRHHVAAVTLFRLN
jgi:hypothetical protein